MRGTTEHKGKRRPKIDVSGLAYARRKNVTVLYVDTDTGEIMQFGTHIAESVFASRCYGMFPDRSMEVVRTAEYSDFIQKLNENTK